MAGSTPVLQFSGSKCVATPSRFSMIQLQASPCGRQFDWASSFWTVRFRKLQILNRPQPFMILASSADGSPVNELLLKTANIAGSGREHTVSKKKQRLIAGIDQTTLVDPWLLADDDSRFAEYYGVQIHHKIARSTSLPENDRGVKLRIPSILLHGFGASLFSWKKTLRMFSEMFEGDALAFDRPAFGLTSRVFPTDAMSSAEAKSNFHNPYTVAFSAALTLAFISFLDAHEAVLIGHSAGCIVALEAYFQAPEKIAALVLVAPAVVAPLLLREYEDAKRPEKLTDRSRSEDHCRNDERRSSRPKTLRVVMWGFAVVMGFLTATKRSFVQVAKNIMRLIFLSAPAVWLIQVIMDKFGPRIVRHAWYSPAKADKDVIDGYTKVQPLQCRHWEKALLEYLLAIADFRKENKGHRLQDITCPVLVVSGDTDRLVPVWNSKRLVNSFLKGEFKLIKNCGHLPQEETPDELVGIIQNFLRRALNDRFSDDPSHITNLQNAPEIMNSQNEIETFDTQN